MGRVVTYHDELGALSGSSGHKKWNNLNDIIRAYGSSPVTVWIGYELPVTASVTVPSTMNLVFTRQGSLSIPSGSKLIINGYVTVIGDHQVFSGDGVVDGMSGQDVVASWFGRTYAGLKKAVSLSAGYERRLLLTPGTWALTDDLKIPRRLELLFQRGAVLNVSSGKTLTVNGSIVAGPWKIFDGAGTISGAPDLFIMSYDWFGSSLTWSGLKPVQGAIIPKLDGGEYKPFWRSATGSESDITGSPQTAAEWLTNAYTVTYVAANQFKVDNEDATAAFVQYRRVKCVLGGSTVYASVSSSSYDGTDTLITLDASVLDATLSTVYLSVVMPGATGGMPSDVPRLTDNENVTGNWTFSGQADFDTVAPTSQVAAAASDELIRKGEVDTEITNNKPLGFISRGSGYYWASVATITFKPMQVDIYGKMCYSSADLTPTMTGLGASEVHYIYVSRPASGNQLSTGEFSNNTTPPTWNATYRQWMNAAGTARCIGWFKTNASSEVIDFKCYDKYVPSAAVELLNTSSPATSLTALSAGAFALRGKVDLEVHVVPAATSDTPTIRIADGDGASGPRLVGESLANQLGGPFANVSLDASGQFQYVSGIASQTIVITAYSWTNPIAML